MSMAFNKVAHYLKGNRKSLETALSTLASCDADFSGENGIDLIDELKDLKDENEIINKFVSGWLDNDSYYKEYDLDISDELNGVVSISLAAIC